MGSHGVAGVTRSRVVRTRLLTSGGISTGISSAVGRANHVHVVECVRGILKSKPKNRIESRNRAPVHNGSRRSHRSTRKIPKSSKVYSGLSG